MTLNIGEIFKEMLFSLETGQKPTASWNFSDVGLQLACKDHESGKIHALVSPDVRLTIGQHTIGITRTFAATVSTSETEINNISFELPDSSPWYSHDQGDEEFKTLSFFKIIGYLETNTPELLTPDFSKVSEDARRLFWEDTQTL